MGTILVENGKLVTFEGIEGSGKTLQLQLLAQELQRLRVPFLASREPGGTPFGRELRKILLKQQGPSRRPVSELLLYLADRYQHLREVIEPALGRGLLVLCDRYHDATRAYQGFARGIPLETIDALSGLLEIRRPDLTLIFDVEVEVGIDRARSRNKRERQVEMGRFEEEAAEFHQRVREAYLEFARREPDRISLVPAAGSPEQVFDQVVTILKKRGVLAETAGAGSSAEHLAGRLRKRG